MSNFISLIKNEQIKIYSRKATWIMFLIVAAIVIVGAVIVSMQNTNLEEYGSDWREELQAENEQLMQEAAENEMPEEFIHPEIAMNNYYLENDIKPQSYDAWQFTMENTGLASMVTLFTVIVAAGIIANEFKWGTIKLLLIRPVTRSKILLSKYVSVLLFGLTLLLFLLLFSFILGAVLYGVNGWDPFTVQEQMNGFIQLDVREEVMRGYILQFITLIIMATLAFMIATIFRSSGMAIGVSIFLMFTGNIMAGFLSQYEWSKYFLFTNTNLNQYMSGMEPMIEGMTLTFSIIVILVYYVIFLAAAWLVFTRRDVAGQ